MTDIINEVSTTVSVLKGEYEQPNVLSTPVVPEAKAKRAPSLSPSVHKPKVMEPEVVVTPSLDEVLAKVLFPVEEEKPAAKVECPDCGKMMSQNTLRYSHGPNCTVKKQRQATREPEVQNVANDMIEYEVQHGLYGKREERTARREAMVVKLAQNAF
jgi:hypothetical protein